MDFNEFKAGSYHQQYQYKSFSPANINHSWTWDDQEIDQLLMEADKKLDELNKLVQHKSEIDEYVKEQLVKEALASCRIEGAKIDYGDLFVRENEISPEKRNDLIEVRNYIEALNVSIKEMKKLPLSSRVLNIAHEILLDTEQGVKKTPGEFRKSQNWVGGKTLKEAIYVPPAHEELGELFRDLEYFIHNDEIKIPNLIKLAIVHYQFFSLHPYLDGNGKVNRILVMLFLHEFKMLAKPVVLLSEVLEKSKTEYLVKLNAVRERNGLAVWIKFFLKAISKAIVTASERMDKFSGLNDKNETLILLTAKD